MHAPTRPFSFTRLRCLGATTRGSQIVHSRFFDQGQVAYPHRLYGGIRHIRSRSTRWREASSPL